MSGPLGFARKIILHTGSSQHLKSNIDKFKHLTNCRKTPLTAIYPSFAQCASWSIGSGPNRISALGKRQRWFSSGVCHSTNNDAADFDDDARSHTTKENAANSATTDAALAITKNSDIKPTDCTQNEAPSDKLTIPNRRNVYASSLAAQKKENAREASTDLISPRAYDEEGADTTYELDRDLGPAIADWDLGPHYKVNREPPGQTLHPADAEDIAIFADAHEKVKYFSAGYDNPEGINYRVVRLSDPVTSPMLRVVRNRRFGVRGQEDGGIVFTLFVSIGMLMMWMGVWQLRRMKWKHDLIEERRNRMQAPIECFDSGPLPWVNNMDEWRFREVQLRGVLDPANIYYIGPRDRSLRNQLRALAVVQLLRLKDGTAVLVNRGWGEDLFVLSGELQSRVPQMVTIRGTVSPGESPTKTAKLHWRVMAGIQVLGQDANVRIFPYCEPATIAKVIPNVDRQAVGAAVIELHDIFWDEDFGIAPEDRMPRGQRKLDPHRKTDYLEFWCSEHTHFSYAVQWFIFGAVSILTGMWRTFAYRRWKF